MSKLDLVDNVETFEKKLMFLKTLRSTLKIFCSIGVDESPLSILDGFDEGTYDP